jgi:hypothetical protein
MDRSSPELIQLVVGEESDDGGRFLIVVKFASHWSWVMGKRSTGFFASWRGRLFDRRVSTMSPMTVAGG